MSKKQTKKSPKTSIVKAGWTPEKLNAFGAELDTVHEEIKSKLGPEDVAYAKKLRLISRTFEVLGRGLLYVGMDPLTWSAGVFTLSIHKQLENAEIGHSALHGAWDGLQGAEKFSSDTFYWESPVSEQDWKREHNILHHQYTNIVGKDPDLNYGSMRTNDKTSWIPYNLTQLSQFFWTAPLFMWVIGFYATGLTDLLSAENDETYAKVLPDHHPKTVLKAAMKTAKKMVPYGLKEFAFWPALAGPFWWKVLAGNVASDAIRNVYTAATIYAGHFGDDLEYYDKDYRPQGRGEWYKMQVEAAHNYEVPWFISKLCGGLDYQIEHHLFPKLPPNRLREIQPKVQEICERYGLKYTRSAWGKNLRSAFKRIKDMSVPPQGLKQYLRTLPLIGPALQAI